ncbi:MAG TPA: hypothetical protein VHU40_02385 [Polyangia bacterium]|nr:hypothetical protein [Polyangia bacterium]
MTATGMEDCAFEVVNLLPGFTRLSKRSGELDGNLPVRAARYCGPVFEGSAAGFQIVLAQPMTVSRDERGKVAWNLTPPALSLVTEQVDAALDLGVREGLLERGSFWHRLFSGDGLPVRGQRAFIWTGMMVRPRAGLWLVIGGAFNRRSRVALVDHAVTDPERFVPLVLEVDLRAVGPEPCWLESELGCVTPVAPRVRLHKQALTAGAPELRQFAEFFSEHYFETKARHPTATYVRCQRERRMKADETCDARLLYAGPDVHDIDEFRRFLTPAGWSATPASPGALPFAVIRNMAPLSWTWQGQTHSAFEVKHKRCLPALRTLWKASFGDEHRAAYEFLSGYALGEQWDQPYVQVQPWVFMPTSTGWSTLVDGVHRPPDYDGMRGLIATDWFHALAMVLRLFGPSTVTIPTRAPLLRALPVQRAVLELGFRESSVDATAPV